MIDEYANNNPYFVQSAEPKKIAIYSPKSLDKSAAVRYN